LPNVVEEITTTSPHPQHRWRVWAVNTQTSRQLGSHWFTMVVGTQTQQLKTTAYYLTCASRSPPPLPQHSRRIATEQWSTSDACFLLTAPWHSPHSRPAAPEHW
jgi:hypothetical protein